MQNFQIVHVIANSGISSLINLVVMAILSIGVWAVIGIKLFSNRKKVKEMNQWHQHLNRDFSFQDLRRLVQTFPHTAFGRIAQTAIKEIEGLSSYVSFDSLESRSQLVQEGIERSVDNERGRNDRFLPYLAICSAVGPLLGLLGTVWGVMDAFLAIGMQGSANITVVAPGIAQALITTIAGLLVAIPAAVAYNYYVSLNRKIESGMYHFGSELISLFKRGDLLALERSAK